MQAGGTLPISLGIKFPSGFVVRMAVRIHSVEEIFEEARRAGIDLDLLDTNLALPVRERWRQHDAALALILKLEAAKVSRDAGLQHVNR